MTRWLLALCVRAYPGARRGRDGAYLLDLALELVTESGVGRQAFSLLRGGFVERLRARRRVILQGAAGAAVAALLVLGGGLAAGADVRAEVEVFSCSGECPDVPHEGADRQRDGWACERQRAHEGVSWRCVSP